MEETDQQPSRGMEQLLKQVYAVHRNTLKGVNSNLQKYKTAYSKAVEKCHQLQKKNEELESENRKLSTAFTTKQNRDGSCCEVIRQSLDTVISSYKQMLADKDARIMQLEVELHSHKRNSLTANAKVTNENKVAVANSSPGHVNQNPDSTSCITPVSKPRQDTGQCSSGVTSEDEDLVFDTTPDDTVKLKLNRKRNKRSRYSEDISPECKKQRKSSPTSQSNKTDDSTIVKVSGRRINDNKEKEARLKEQRNNTKTEKINKNSGKLCKEKQKVLVSDTCVPDLNESLVSKGFTVKDNEQMSERQAAGIKDDDISVMVVPETLAIDMDDTVAPEGVNDKVDNVDGKFKPELTDISEGCEDSVLSESGKNGNYSIKNKVGKIVGSGKEKLKDIPPSFRSILDSSGSESSEEKQELSEELDLDSNSLAKDSDDNDTFFDSLPNSQNFSRSKTAGSSMSDASLDTSRRVRNTCKNMKEVNALFETPESKGSVKDSSCKSNQNNISKKPLFKKGKKENLKDEVDTEVVLRRSPRKHKQTALKDNIMRTPTKTRTKLNNEKIRTSPKFSRHRNSESGVTEEDDNNVTEAHLTIEPDHVGENATEHTLENETETLVCYNVMPVKDGNIDPTRKFQVKVKGIKKPKRNLPQTDVLESDIKTAQAVNINNETLKSPSILDQDGRSRIGDFSGVIRVNRSGSASNDNDFANSDIESPLIIKTNKYREQIDDDLEIVDWNSAKGQNKSCSSNSQSSHSLSTKRNRLRSSQQSETFKKPDTVRKSCKGRQKNVHQTTLTQGFFSPKKNKADKDCDEEGFYDNTVGDKRKKTGEFKSPGKCRLSRERARKLGNADVATGERETTEVPASAGILVEVRDQSGNVGEGRLNGSLDPSAELSEWCRDPETLPSLDTDFCEADLQADINSLPRTSTMVEEDTQDIPCSSTSYKFLPKRQRKKDAENIDPKKTVINLDDSFDRLPKKQGSDVAHVAVVRKRDERQKLQGHSCKECLQYYTSAGRSDEEIKQHMQQCSRHRAQFVPPDTPPHFWSIGFIETQEPNESGIKNDADIDLDAGGEQDAPTYRRRRRLNKYFKSKNERAMTEEDSQNSQQYAA